MIWLQGVVGVKRPATGSPFQRSSLSSFHGSPFYGCSSYCPLCRLLHSLLAPGLASPSSSTSYRQYFLCAPFSFSGIHPKQQPGRFANRLLMYSWIRPGCAGFVSLSFAVDQGICLLQLLPPLSMMHFVSNEPAHPIEPGRPRFILNSVFAHARQTELLNQRHRFRFFKKQRM